MKLPSLFVFLACAAAFTALAQDKKSAAESIFDGKTLEGWKAPEMSYWSVKDGAITATSSEKNPCPENQFLVWQGGEIGDFELRLKFRVDGGPRANSGIQVRSQVEEDGHVKGYQVDISQPDPDGKKPDYLGAVYDERGRKMLASRGQKTVITAEGEKKSTPIEGADEVLETYKSGEWADYQIRFVDNKLTVKLNGVTTAVVVDNQEAEREMSGILALQLHSGPPMTVQFKDLKLKKL
ncbi:MAG: DUF1080 domain-containing protein [Verrucomicrobiales bacterium]|nr:DUF1080 domain-containing protein [Verrucomicrobiales bacterium]